ncbi:hypothetical protein ACSBR1_004429 [Camellia fascicularis]
MSVKQLMAAQSDNDANHYTLNLLQNKTNEIHRLNAQLSLLQHMYKMLKKRLAICKSKTKS